MHRNGDDVIDCDFEAPRPDVELYLGARIAGRGSVTVSRVQRMKIAMAQSAG